MKAATKKSHRSYTRAMALSAVSFAITHGSQSMIKGLISQHSFNVNPTGFLVLAPYLFIEAIVFFVAGYLIAYFPSRAGYKSLSAIGKNGCGFVQLTWRSLGYIIPTVVRECSVFVFPPPDDPSYFARCVEFGLPMTIAGAIGGYTFWRWARGSAGKGEFAADQFS